MDLREFIGQAMKKRKGLNLIDVVREAYPRFQNYFSNRPQSPYYQPGSFTVPYETPNVDLLANTPRTLSQYIDPEFQPIPPVKDFYVR